MRLIDADALKVRIIEDVPGFLDGGSTITKAFILAMLETRKATPTIDAVPVVRCKDCKWYQAGIDIDGKPFTRCNGDVRVYGHTMPDWFCADGKRRDDDD